MKQTFSIKLSPLFSHYWLKTVVVSIAVLLGCLYALNVHASSSSAGVQALVRVADLSGSTLELTEQQDGEHIKVRVHVRNNGGTVSKDTIVSLSVQHGLVYEGVNSDTSREGVIATHYERGLHAIQWSGFEVNSGEEELIVFNFTVQDTSYSALSAVITSASGRPVEFHANMKDETNRRGGISWLYNWFLKLISFSI